MITIESYRLMLSEYLEIGSLSLAEQAKYHLILRYEDKISTRLKLEQAQLRAKAKLEFDKLMHEIMTKSAWLELLPKSEAGFLSGSMKPYKFGDPES